MRTLKEALSSNVELPPADTLGSDARPPTPAIRVDKEGLRRDLRQVKRENNRYFLVCVVMIVVLFALSLAAVVFKHDQPDVLKVVMAAFGVTCAGLIGMMIKLWREKSTTELVILLATHMEGDALNAVLAVLLKKL